MNNDDKILKEIKIIRADMIEIKMAVMGSEKLKINGLIQKVDKHSKYIEADKKFKYGLIGGVSVISFGVGLLIALWKKVF